MIEDEDEKQIMVSINDEVSWFSIPFFLSWPPKNIPVSIARRIRTCVYAQRRESFAQLPITIKALSWKSHYGS